MAVGLNFPFTIIIDGIYFLLYSYFIKRLEVERESAGLKTFSSGMSLFYGSFLCLYRYLVVFAMGRREEGVDSGKYHQLMLAPLLKGYSEAGLLYNANICHTDYLLIISG